MKREALRIAVRSAGVVLDPSLVSAAASVLIELIQRQDQALSEIREALARIEGQVEQLVSAPLEEAFHHLRDVQTSTQIDAQRSSAVKARDAFVKAASQGHSVQRAIAAGGASLCWAVEGEPGTAASWGLEMERQFAAAALSAARAFGQDPPSFRKLLALQTPSGQLRDAVEPVGVVLRPLASLVEDLNEGSCTLNLDQGISVIRALQRHDQRMIVPGGAIEVRGVQPGVIQRGAPSGFAKFGWNTAEKQGLWIRLDVVECKRGHEILFEVREGGTANSPRHMSGRGRPRILSFSAEQAGRAFPFEASLSTKIAFCARISPRELKYEVVSAPDALAARDG